MIEYGKEEDIGLPGIMPSHGQASASGGASHLLKGGGFRENKSKQKRTSSCQGQAWYTETDAQYCVLKNNEVQNNKGKPKTSS